MLTLHQGDKGGDVQTPPEPAVLFPVLSSRRWAGAGPHVQRFFRLSKLPAPPRPCPLFCILLPQALKTHIPTQMRNCHHSWGHRGSLAGYDVTLHYCLLWLGCSPPSSSYYYHARGCQVQAFPSASCPGPQMCCGKAWVFSLCEEGLQPAGDKTGPQKRKH